MNYKINYKKRQSNLLSENNMKANQDECLFLPSVNISTTFLLPACLLESSGSQQCLVVTNDRKLNFHEHITNLYDKSKP